MSLNGLQRAGAKPRGGIVSVALVGAPAFTGAVYDRGQGCFTSVDTAEPFAEYVFREDKASYCEETIVDNGRSLVRHVLTMEFPAGSAAREAVEQLVRMSAGGFVAVVETGAGERLLAGYSVRFGVRFPLRLKRAASGQGSCPSDFPTETIVLVSEDTECSRPAAR